MGRPRGYNREEILAAAILLFWKKGYAATSLQDLEKSTGVNKSGLYSEFKDKDDLYLASLEYYCQTNGVLPILNAQPLGWANIEAFLKRGLDSSGSKGCFIANSVREAPILTTRAKSFMISHMQKFREVVKKNIVAGGCNCSAELATDIVLTFNSGLCLEQNLLRDSNVGKRIDAFLKTLKQSRK